MLNRLWLSIRIVLALSAVFLIVSTGVLMLRLSSDSKAITSSVQQALGSVQITLQHTDAAVTDARRTLEIAGGTLNIARETLKKEQGSIQQANAATVQSMQDLDALIKNLDSNQAQITAGSVDALKSIQTATSSITPVMQQTQKDLETLQPVIEKSQELLNNSTDTMAHVSGTTQDIQTEIHKFVYPPPRKWYQKYITDPVRFGLKMLTVPLTQL